MKHYLITDELVVTAIIDEEGDYIIISSPEFSVMDEGSIIALGDLVTYTDDVLLDAVL